MNLSQKIAAYQYEGADYISVFNSDPGIPWVRVSEFVDLEFPPLSHADVVRAQVEALDAKADELRDAILAIERRKSELLALPAPVDDDNRGPDEPDPYLYGDEDTGEDTNVDLPF